MYVEYDDSAFHYPQTIGDTAPSITGLGPADESMIDTIFIMPNKSTNPDATMMIVVDEVTPETNPKTYQYVYVGNINDLPSDVLTENSIVNDLTTGGTDKPLSAEQGRTLNSHVNYTTCGSGAADQVKLISADGFELSTHLRLLVKMTYANTAENPTLNINGTGAKAISYNGAVASAENSWNANEILDIFYDGSQYVARPYRNIDAEPTAGSKNLVGSGGMVKNCKVIPTGLSNSSGRAYITLNLIKGIKYRVLFNSDIVFSETSDNACVIRNGNIQGEVVAILEDKTVRFVDFVSQGETTVAVYLNGQNLTTTFCLIEMQPIDIEKSRAEGAEIILQGNIDAEETRAKAAEKDIQDDVDPIVEAVSELDWQEGQYEYTFNGTSSKAVLNSSIQLLQNGDSIEFMVSDAPDSVGSIIHSFIKGSSSSGVGISVGKQKVMVRANDSTYIFDRTLSGSHITDDHLWKISFENNNISLYEDGVLSVTYEGQKAITLVGLGYRRNEDPLWSGVLKVLKVNNSPVELKDIATLTDVTKTLIPGTGNRSFLSESEKNLLYSPYQDMYVSKTATEMDIYLKHPSGKYIKYPFNYRYSAFVAEAYPTFYDNWGIGRVALCSFNGESMIEEAKLFYNSEAEMTVKLNGGNTVGGAMHGFDNIVVDSNGRKFCILIDNLKIAEDAVIPLMVVDSIEVFQTSQVNPPYTNTGVFGTVDKHWLWENGKFTLTAKFTATESIELDHIYSSLLGCYRRWEGNTENNYLTKSAIKNNHPYKEYDIADGWYDSDLVNADKDCTKITAYGDRGIGISMEVLETNGLANGGMFITTNNNPYNKIYNKVCADTELDNGDSLFAKTRWRII